MGKLPVMEMFYTIQGEGFHTGKAAFFIRLAGCDVGCVWCDVKESWEVSDEQWIDIADIANEAIRYPGRLAVITGGEPCMYDLAQLLDSLRELGFKCHLETSGAYPLKGTADWICVSPKKFKSALNEMIEKADELKIVISHKSDLEWAESLSQGAPARCALFLQPESSKANKLHPLIVDHIKSNPHWRISIQTHKILGIP